MFNIKTAALAAMLAMPMAASLADPASATMPQNSARACPTGTFDTNYPNVPLQCVECAAPGCPSCHNERTQATVADTDAAERNCPAPVKPH